jgi:hypothetical protein
MPGPDGLTSHRQRGIGSAWVVAGPDHRASSPAMAAGVTSRLFDVSDLTPCSSNLVQKAACAVEWREKPAMKTRFCPDPYRARRCSASSIGHNQPIVRIDIQFGSPIGRCHWQPINASRTPDP